ncbi:MAG: ATP-binding protein, partial [Proteobacteria bacterium]|nr:ATP-binding protein [Pseudomonadota bacterium]
PPIFSELINRDEPSSNSVKARRDLMYRMVSHPTQENLGYDGFPADAGLYFSVLKNLGLHRKLIDEYWGFAEPKPESVDSRLATWWDASRNLLLGKGKLTKLDALYAFWADKPYGLRKGALPLLGLAFLMAHRSQLALYVDGVFAPNLSEAVIDEWLLDPNRITFKHVEASENQAKLLRAVAEAVSLRIEPQSNPTPLDVARELVSVALALPQWTKRTTGVSQRAQEIRTMLLRASDPHKVLFVDIPTLLDTNAPETIGARLAEALDELSSAYGAMLKKVRSHLLEALDHSHQPLAELCHRVQSVKGLTGDLKLDAFASRLEQLNESGASIEGLISLAVSKPAAQWVDRD